MTGMLVRRMLMLVIQISTRITGSPSQLYKININIPSFRDTYITAIQFCGAQELQGYYSF
jgi:hypothetical protein